MRPPLPTFERWNPVAEMSEDLAARIAHDVFPGRRVVGIIHVPRGCTNSIYRVCLAGAGPDIAVRLSLRDQAANDVWGRELAARAGVRVPRTLMFCKPGIYCSYGVIVSEWIPLPALDDIFCSLTDTQLWRVGRALGGCISRLHTIPGRVHGPVWIGDQLTSYRTWADMIAEQLRMLSAIPEAHQYLGSSIAITTRRLLALARHPFLTCPPVFAHHDLSGGNVLVGLGRSDVEITLIDFDAMIFTCPAVGEFPRLRTNVFANGPALAEGFDKEYGQVLPVPRFSDEDWLLLRRTSHISGLSSLLKRHQRGNLQDETSLRYLLKYWATAADDDREVLAA